MHTDQLDPIAKGLAGIAVDATAVSNLDARTNTLTYRGYPVAELAERASFEEVAHLLWYGELPSQIELAAFAQRERAQRRADRGLLSLIEKLPDTCHPMDVVRTVVSYLGAHDEASGDSSAEAAREKALRLLAVLPTAVAADMRRRRGLAPIAPHHGRGYAENFLTMCFGKPPTPKLARAFEISLILYAEHGFNASTFAARVVTSTGSDFHSAVGAAVGALKGPLHGGANEAVMRSLLRIADPAAADEWVRAELAAGNKIMGFGHRVCKNGDSRVPVMRAALAEIVEARGGVHWLRLADEVERAMAAQTGIKPNLDFPTAPAYHLLGFEIDQFTPLFAMARAAGWAAHIVEQSEANALIRPLAVYCGREQRTMRT
jgi:citrate synthase